MNVLLADQTGHAVPHVLRFVQLRDLLFGVAVAVEGRQGDRKMSTRVRDAGYSKRCSCDCVGHLEVVQKNHRPGLCAMAPPAPRGSLEAAWVTARVTSQRRLFGAQDLRLPWRDRALSLSRLAPKITLRGCHSEQIRL